MVRNVNISNASDCQVYVDGSEQELDLETPLCTIIDGKHLNLHISRKTYVLHPIYPPCPSITYPIMTRKRTSLASDKLACMVVLNNLVSGNTVYYKTQLLSYKLTESKILVSIAILTVLSSSQQPGNYPYLPIEGLSCRRSLHYPLPQD